MGFPGLLTSVDTHREAGGGVAVEVERGESVVPDLVPGDRVDPCPIQIGLRSRHRGA